MSEERLLSLLERIANALEESLRLQKTNQDTPKKYETRGPKQDLIEFLQSRGAMYLREKSENKDYQKWNDQAYFMGEKFTDIGPVLHRIKRTLQSESVFSVSLKNSSPSQISHIVSLCHRLHNNGLLRHFQYKKSPKFQLHITPPNQSSAINFLNGEWFEQFIAIKLQQLLDRFKTNLMISHYQIYRNVIIRLPGDQERELDLLVQINKEFFWIECKSGNLQNAAEQIVDYNHIADILKFNRNTAFTVVANPLPPSTSKIRSLSHMTLCSVPYLLSNLKKQIYTTTTLKVPTKK